MTHPDLKEQSEDSESESFVQTTDEMLIPFFPQNDDEEDEEPVDNTQD